MNNPMIKHKFYKPGDIEEFERKTQEMLTAITDQIMFYRYAYYVKANPVITDREYDRIEHYFLSTLVELKAGIGIIENEVERVSSDRVEDYGDVAKVFDEWIKDLQR